MPDRLNGRLTPEGTLDGSLSNRGTLRGVLGGIGSVVTYASLPDKPSINNVELVGNKTTSDLHISFNDLEDKPTFPDVDEIEDRLDTLEGETASLDLRLTSAEGNISSLAGRVTTNEGDISDLETGLSTAEGNISSLAGRVTTNEGDISDLETGLRAAEGNISSLAGRMTTAEGDISSLAGRMTTAEGSITSLAGRVTTNEGDISDLETGLSTAEGNITSLAGRVTTNEGDISDLQGDMSQAQSDITQLNSSLTEKRIDILLHDTNSVPTTATSYNLLHDINDYDCIYVLYKYSNNVINGVMVPVDYFLITSSGARIQMPLFTSNGTFQSVINVYYHTDTSVYLQARDSVVSSSNYKVSIYGIKF